MRILTIFALSFALGQAAAQDALFLVEGNTAKDLFGQALCSVGDLDGDGVAEFAVGAPYDDVAGENRGSVSIYSGADRTLVQRLEGIQLDDGFGQALDGAGDVNGDGVPDVIVGAPQNGSPVANPGRAVVYSGADWSELLSLSGGSGFVDLFGRNVGGLGDVDGDGLADVYARELDIFQSQAFVNVYSGGTGNLLYRLTGGPNEDDYAIAIAVLGDLDDDGVRDIAVSDKDYFSFTPTITRGRVIVYSGATGALRGYYYGDSTTWSFGIALSCAGDVNGDGKDDLLIGSNMASAGRVQVVSGVDLTELYRLEDPFPGSGFGSRLAPAGDVDGDGSVDFVVGAPGNTPTTTSAGTVYVYSGPAGEEIFSVEGVAINDRLGSAVDGLGDVDGDGRDDVGASKPFFITTAQTPGQVWAFGVCGDGSWFPYCAAKASSSGCLAQMSASGPASAGPVSGANDFTVTMSGAQGQRPGLLFSSVTGLTSLPFFGGTMCMLPPIRREPALFTGGTQGACDGGFGIVVNDGNLFPPSGSGFDAGPGGTSWIQGWYRDPLLMDGFDVALSNAIQLNWGMGGSNDLARGR